MYLLQRGFLCSLQQTHKPANKIFTGRENAFAASNYAAKENGGRCGQKTCGSLPFCD